MTPDQAARFWAKVDVRGPDECWPWLAATDRDGYGFFQASRDHRGGAHRFAYEDAHGPIPEHVHDDDAPDRATVDHTCHTNDTSCPGGSACPHRACQNPAHLEVVTDRENIRRGRVGVLQRSKTHCPIGHPYSPGNTYLKPNGHRSCRACALAKRIADYTHCQHGHLFDEANTYTRSDGRRGCRACRERVNNNKPARPAQRNRTHCQRGHPLISDNTYIRPDGYRECRVCSQARKSAWAARRAVVA